MSTIQCNIHDNAPRDVYMTRHSARIDREGRWTPLPGHSRDDAHLSSGGEQASLELAKRLDSIHLSHIISSPYYRCIQTVEPVAKSKKIPIKIEPGVCEVLSSGNYPPGFWDAKRLAREKGLPIDVSYEPVMTKNDLQREYSDGDAARRSARVAKIIRKRLDGPILFCGHGASCLGIMDAFGGSGYVGYSSLTHFRPTGDNGKERWEVVGKSNDVSHLSEKLKRQSLDSAW